MNRVRVLSLRLHSLQFQIAFDLVRESCHTSVNWRHLSQEHRQTLRASSGRSCSQVRCDFGTKQVLFGCKLRAFDYVFEKFLHLEVKVQTDRERSIDMLLFVVLGGSRFIPLLLRRQ